MSGPITKYGYWRACSPVDRKTGNPLGLSIPAKAYQQKYFISRRQLLRLVRRRDLKMIRLKGAIFIFDEPPPMAEL